MAPRVETWNLRKGRKEQGGNNSHYFKSFCSYWKVEVALDKRHLLSMADV